jgi:phosphoglycolate phosphatase-like HAD superfamily hydrolase
MNRYLDLSLQNGSALIKVDSMTELKKIEAIIFDCDGVLIDTTKSYDRTIQKAAAHLASSILGRSVDSNIFEIDLIYTLRSTALYNNDWDTTFTLTACLLACVNQGTRSHLIRALQHDRSGAGVLTFAPERVGPKFRRMIGKLAVSIGKSGSPDIYRSLRGEVGSDLLSALVGYMDYPTDPKNSLLTMVFDEYFYGSKSAAANYGRKPVVGNQKGLIRNERPLIDRQTLERLASCVGRDRLGLATGRDSAGTRRTLNDLMSYFNPQASCFIMDEVMSGKSVKKVGKPQPYSLLKAAEPFRDSPIMYVGDSMEDVVMFRNARATRNSIMFTGVCGLRFKGSSKVEQFRARGANIIVRSVCELSEVMEKLS